MNSNKVHATDFHILIIDDDPYFRAKLQNHFNKYGKIHIAENGKSAQEHLQTDIDFSIVLIDLSLEGRTSGLEILEKAKKKNLYCIILTDYDDPLIIKRAYELGCDHYLTKDQFESIMDILISERMKSSASFSLDHFFQHKFITQDTTLMSDILSLKRRILGKRPIFIEGETGVGKGVLAELIHQMHGEAPLPEEKFISLNVSAIAENLIESELFGHVKGSFTGATTSKQGLISRADGGTLFLDEIATMSMSMQQKLLKVLEEKKFYPVGGHAKKTSDFQLVTATCEDILNKIKEETFRLDLYHRINSIVINIPPLRQRPDDIPLLIQHFLGLSSRRIFITDEAMILLQQHSWPGNVRELKSTIQDLVASGLGIITPAHLPTSIAHHSSPQTAGFSIQSTRFLTHEQLNYLQLNGLRKFIEKVESEAFISIMHLSQGSMQDTRQILGVSRSGLYRLLQQAGQQNVM